jgi:putative transposase
MRWADLPKRYGKYKSVHKRFVRWADSGVWDRLFDDLVGDQKNPYLMLGYHRLSSSASGHEPQKKAKTRLWGVPEVD